MNLTPFQLWLLLAVLLAAFWVTVGRWMFG